MRWSIKMKIHRFPFTIAYADTDAEGIVYHARYLEIAERARMNWLRGVTKCGDDIGFVVRELNIKYLQPLRVADEFVVDRCWGGNCACRTKVRERWRRMCYNKSKSCVFGW